MSYNYWLTKPVVTWDFSEAIVIGEKIKQQYSSQYVKLEERTDVILRKEIKPKSRLILPDFP